MVRKLFVLFLLTTISALPVNATPTVKGSSPSTTTAVKQPPQGDLQVWEQKFFGQYYDHDPLDKRLQRIELMIFGGTQEGSISERLDQLRSAISSRLGQKTDKPAASEALTELEQKILKRTYPGEHVEQRITRLEEKVFGKASPAMVAADRIERLKRTLGIGETGPMFAEVPSQSQSPFQGDIPTMPGVDPEFNRELSNVFRHLNEQLRHLPSRPHAMPMPMNPDPWNGSGGALPFGMQEIPFGIQELPFGKRSPQNDPLPPYLDPNSI